VSHWTPKDQQQYTHRANYVFNGQKANIYEGGHHIPYIAKWPTKIKPGSSSNQIMCTTDLLATLSGITGKSLTAGAGEDSYNMLPAYLSTNNNQQIRDYTIHHSLNGFFSIRKGKWKLTTQLGSGGFSIPSEISVETGQTMGTLYDMKNDIEEINNLYNANPKIVKELTSMLNEVKLTKD
jgi:arylsulfatase A